MSLEVSDKCPECNYEYMEEIDREVETIGSPDYDTEPDYKDISLDEWCPNCGFSQTKFENSPDPDEYYENKREL